MKTRHHLPVSGHWTRLPKATLLGASLFLAPVFLSGQLLPEEEEEEEEEIFELSPFTVESGEDIGYLATNTLAGSRINAQLRDTAASVSVFTTEFLNDLGASDLESAMAYSVSAERSVGDLGQNPSGNNNVDAMPSYQFRVRGFNSTRSRNYFRWELTLDTYNTERLDESRGPNSILFGIGSAGGIINTTTKRARIGSNFTRAQFRVGSWDERRATLDVNHTLIEDHLALRANFMAEESDSWQYHVGEEDMRMHWALTFRPYPKTTLRVEFERGLLEDVVSRPFHVLDEYSQWDDTLYETGTWTDSPGARRSTWWGGTVPVYIGNGQSMVDTRAQMESEFYLEPLEDFPSYSDWWRAAGTATRGVPAGEIPPRVSTDGPGAKRDHDFWVYTSTLEHEVFDNFFIELAHHRVESDWISHWSGLSSLRVDPNVYQQNGEPNPYAGDYYLEGTWDRRTRTISTNSLRITASLELDLGNFGRHNFVGLIGQDHNNLGFINEYEAITSEEIINPTGNYTPAWGATPDNGRYIVTRRKYVSLDDWEGFHIPSWEEPINGIPYVSGGDQYNGASIETGWIPRGTSQNDDKVENDNYLIAAQSYFLNDRLVTTLGYRKDEVQNTTHAVERNEKGYYAINYDKPITQDFLSETITAGVVGHVTDNFSPFFNISENSNYPNFLIKVLPDDLERPFDGVTPPPASGIGWDTGVMFSFLEGKISGRLTYYEADVEDVENWTGGYRVVTTYNDNINDGLRRAGVIDQDTADFRTHTATGTLFDEKSNGVELSVTTNLKPNWRLTTNYSFTDRDRFNSYEDAQKLLERTRDWALAKAAAYIEENDLDLESPGDLLLGQPPLPGEPDMRSTLSSTFMEWQADIDFYRRGQEVKRGLRKHKFNIFTAYDFIEGPLEGLTVGGGFRYQSKNIIGVDPEDNILHGIPIEYFDLLLRYDFGESLLKGVRTRVQLNVRNLFDNTDLIPIRYAPVPNEDHSYPDVIDRYTTQQPRRIFMTVTMAF